MSSRSAASRHGPLTYEKLQIFDLAATRDDDWSIFLDADALVLDP